MSIDIDSNISLIWVGESEINQVDNAGRHDPTREEKRPQALMWPTARAARESPRCMCRAAMSVKKISNRIASADRLTVA